MLRMSNTQIIYITFLEQWFGSAENRWRGCQTVQQLKAEGNVHVQVITM